MLGVLKRRWKPKRSSSNNNNRQQPPPDPLDTPASIITSNNTSNATTPPHLIPCHPPPTINNTITEKAPRIVAPSARQVHPVYEDKAQLLTYDKPPPPTPLCSDSNHHVVNNKRASSSLDNNQLGFGKHSGVSSPEHSPPPYQKRASVVEVDLTYNGFPAATPITANGTATPPKNTASPVSPYPIVPNICVAAGGRIEFIKSPPSPPPPTATTQIHPIKTTVPLPPPRLDGATAPAVARAVSACSDGVDTGKCAISPPPTARCCAPPSPAMGVPHPLVTEARITVTRGLQTDDERMMEEKYDDDKEHLVEKIAELEDELEAAKKAEIKEKANLLKLQRQLSRRETAHRDAERERRLRVDSESRTKQALQEAARCRSRLKLLTNEFSRMEESVRSMLVYKKQAEQLRQEKAALTIAFENRCQQYQATVVRLNQEVQQLRAQLDKPFVASVQKADGGGNRNNGSNQDFTQCSMLQRHVEEARKQYEKCLDDVANQVVRALVAQKGLKEEVATLNARIQELETQNSALTSMLVHQIRNSDATNLSQRESVCLNGLLDPVEVKESDATSIITSNDVSPALNNVGMTSSLTFKHCNSFNSEILEKSPNNDASTTLGEEVERTISRIEKHLSADSDILETRFSIEDKKRHQVLTKLWTDLKKAEVTPRRLIEALSAVDAALLLPPKRPMSLNLQIPILHQGAAVPQNIATIGTARCKRTRPVLCHHAVRPSNAIASNDIANVSVSTTSSSSGKLISGVNSHHPNIGGTSTSAGTTTVPNSSSILLQNGSSIGSGNDESPESNSGNRDEGYSTMSSDVQTTTSSATDVVTVRCSSSSTGGGSTGSRETLIATNGRGGCLEDLQEAIDESCATAAAAAAASDYLHHLVVTGTAAGVVDCCEAGDTDVLYIPLGLIGNLKSRNSFPPGKDLLPFQHIMRSFSDSHLCIKITTAPSPCYSFSSPISSSPSILLLDITEKGGNPLRRAKATTSLLANTNLIFHEESSPGSEDYIDCPRLDAEYIQHWLRLDETRSAMQQQQQLLELEYDTTELEDWSLSLSSEDLAKEQWRRNAETTITPGQISLSTLPSIQENNALELEEDSNECLWNNSSYMVDKEGSEIVTLLMDTNNSTEQQWPYAVNYHLNLNNSPDNSWSSNGSDCCPSNEPETFSKRSSAALSGCSDDTGELPAVGTDFTRDFYRLVKFESTKSLASTSSRSVAGSAAISENGVGDRETALQNVLTFIAEQQKYVQAREDSVTRSCSLADLTKEFNIEAPPQQLKDIKICECDRERIYNDTDENYVTLKQLCAEYTLNEQNTLANEAITSSSKPLITPPPLTNISTSVFPQNSMNIAYADEVCLVQALEDASVTENCSPIGDLPVDICSSISVELASTEYQNGVFSMEPMEGQADDESEKLENELIQSTASTDSNNQSESLTSSVSTPDTVISKIPRRKLSISRIPISPAKVISSPTRTIQSQSLANSSPITNSPIHQTNSADSSPKLSKIPQKKSRISRPKSHSNNSSPTHKPKLPKKDTPPKSPKCTKSSNINGPTGQHISSSEHLPQSAGGYRYSSASIVSTIIDGPPHRAVSFHERATSKDVIDELNRMIRNGGEDGGSSQECLDVVEGQANGTVEKLDEAACKATGWIHVERDVDLTDPKMRANLLDVMMASVSSDSSPTSSCGGSVTSESVEEPPDYGQLHRIHKFHRQKKVNAIRPTDNNGLLAVVRVAGPSSVRPSIIGRPDFYLRYGEKEREAVASFDFLDELSGGSSSGGSGGGSPSAGGHGGNGCLSPQSLSFDADGLIGEDDRSRGVCPI